MAYLAKFNQCILIFVKFYFFWLNFNVNVNLYTESRTHLLKELCHSSLSQVKKTNVLQKQVKEAIKTLISIHYLLTGRKPVKFHEEFGSFSLKVSMNVSYKENKLRIGVIQFKLWISTHPYKSGKKKMVISFEEITTEKSIQCISAII